MNAVKGQVIQLVDQELAAANERFPQFHSAHEGWAVIQEEIEECGDELSEIFSAQKEAWEEIRADKKPNVNIAFVHGHAINLACEAIQVAAMCKKFLNLEGNP